MKNFRKIFLLIPYIMLIFNCILQKIKKESDVGRFLLKRILIMIPVFLGMTFIVFMLTNLTPGSPVDAMITPDMTPADIRQMEINFGLDQPLLVQYAKWLGRLFTGNLGYSYRTGALVASDIAERIWPTIQLTLSALIISILLGVTLGVVAACKPYSIWDYLASGISFLGAGIPQFFLALIGIYIFSVKLRILPTGGMYTSASSATAGDIAVHMILPTLTLVLSMSGSYIRQTRSAMLEVLGEEYIKMARADGTPERRVLYRHTLRNAMLPISTAIGMSIPLLIAGSVIIEEIFGWPGMGSLMVLSIQYRDYPVIMGATVYITIAVMVINVVMDVIYALLDPKVRN